MSTDVAVYHPGLGHRPPSLAELLIDADHSAAAVLRLAGRLAAARVEATGRCAAALDELQRPPWSGPKHPPPPSPNGITPTDLVRALLVAMPDSLSECLPGGGGAELTAAVQHWTALASREGAEQTATRFEAPWALHLSLDKRLRGPTRASIDTLVRMLDTDACGALGSLSAGEASLLAQEEARRALHARHGASDRDWTACWDVPPAYYDRHDGLSHLDDALSAGPGVLVVGDRGSGRTSLVRAWGLRARFGDAPARWDGARLRLNPFEVTAGSLDGDDPPWLDPAAGCWVLAFSPSDPSWWRMGQEDQWPYMSRAIERLGCWAIEHEAPLRLIVVATEDELERLHGAAPVVRRFARVNVPPLRASDMPIVWSCNALDRGSLVLEQTLFALWLLTDEEAVAHAPWRPHPRLQGWEGAAPAWVRRMTGQLRSGPRLSKDSRIADVRRRFHVDDARLEALERLTTSLRRTIGAAHDEPSANDEGGR